MFKKSGEKVKKLALVLFWLTLIACVIGGIVLIIIGIKANNNYNSAGTAMIIEGIIMIPVGILVAWLGSIVYYAIGQSAASAEQNTELLLQLLNKQNGANAQAVKAEDDKAGYTYENKIPPKFDTPPNTFPDGWFCSQCGTKNSKVVSICTNCGHKNEV